LLERTIEFVKNESNNAESNKELNLVNEAIQKGKKIGKFVMMIKHDDGKLMKI
jgi:hypothetical protein